MLKEWAERRRRAAAQRESERQAALIASNQAAVEMDRVAAQAKDKELEAQRQAVYQDVEQYIQKLPPLGTSVEAAIDGLLVESRLNPGEADLHRPTFVALAVKFARPDERLVGVYVKTRLSSNSARLSYPIIAVAFTHGFGVKCGSRTFRTDLASANPHHSTQAYPTDEPLLMVTASVRLGNEMCVEVGEKQGRVGYLYLILAAQAILSRESRAPNVAKSRKQARPRPKPVLSRTWRDAELVAAEWMKYWGYTNVAATAVGTDGGIDVVSNEAVAQVKAETSATGRPKVQQHHGVAVSEGKTAIFFALGGFTPAARRYAEENNILLFRFDLQGEPEPVNTAAHSLAAKRH